MGNDLELKEGDSGCLNLNGVLLLLRQIHHRRLKWEKPAGCLVHVCDECN